MSVEFYNSTPTMNPVNTVNADAAKKFVAKITSRVVPTEMQKELINYEKGKVLTNIDTKTFDLFSKNPNEYVVPHTTPDDRVIPWKLLKNIYVRVPVVANAVNNTSDFAVQAGYELETSVDAKKKIKKWEDEHNFELILDNIFNQMQIFGNSYMSINKRGTDVKLLPPDTIYVVVAKGGRDDGKVIGYKQIISMQEAISFTTDEIIHFKWNDIGTNFYGLSDIFPVLSTLTKMLNWHDDLGNILHRFASPFIHWKVGTPEFPGNVTQVDEVTNAVNDRLSGEDLVTSTAVEGLVIGSGGKMIQPDGLVKHLENQLIAGMRVPEIFVRGGQTSNKATADVELQAFDRKVKAMQKTVAFPIENQLYKKIAPGAKTKMVWNEFSAEGEESRARRIQLLTSAGIPLKVALKLVGWNSYVDEVEKEREKAKQEQQQMLDQSKAKLGGNMNGTDNRAGPGGNASAQSKDAVGSGNPKLPGRQ